MCSLLHCYSWLKWSSQVTLYCKLQTRPLNTWMLDSSESLSISGSTSFWVCCPLPLSNNKYYVTLHREWGAGAPGGPFSNLSIPSFIYVSSWTDSDLFWKLWFSIFHPRVTHMINMLTFRQMWVTSSSCCHTVSFKELASCSGDSHVMSY